MFALIASLALAPAAAATAPRPSAEPPAAAVAPSVGAAKPARHSAKDTLPAGPWWEKLTVTMDGDGTPKACEYQSSVKPEAAADCALAGADFGDHSAESVSQKDQYMKLTFERRFSPGATAPAPPPLQTGDTLLGSEMMALAISAKGKVTGCKIVASTGDMPPDYSCDDASTEQFADLGKSAAGAREGFMSVRIYGHSESLTMRESANPRRG